MDRIILYPTLQGQGLEGVGRRNSSSPGKLFKENGICVAGGLKNEQVKTGRAGTSLVVQWLRLHAPKAGGLGSIPDQITRSLMPQVKEITG